MDIPAIDRRALPPSATISEWRSSDGWRHRRIDWAAPAGAAPRGSLLFAGGRGDFIEKYFEAQHHWHGRDWIVTSFDWRGQGASRGGTEDGHLDDLTVLVEDLDAFVDEWREETPGPHVVIAHSMGGHVLARLLAERKPKIDAAVLVAPMLMINSAPLPGWGSWWLAATLSAFGWGRRPAWQRGDPPPVGSARQSYLTACPDRYQDELWWWRREPGYDLGAPSWGWLSAAYRSCARLTPERLRAIEPPVLLLGAERDRLVSAAAIRRAAGLIPNARLKMFPDSAHEILREADPIRLEALTAIDAFLDEQAG